MIYAIVSIISMSFIRRIDGMDKDHMSKLKRGIVGAFVRIMPIVIFTIMASISFGNEWAVYVSGAVLGIAVSASLQEKYKGWEKFDLNQLGRFWPVMLIYATMCIYSPVLSASGVASCLLAGLLRPALDRLNVRNYTVHCEYAEGALMALPFLFI